MFEYWELNLSDQTWYRRAANVEPAPWSETVPVGGTGPLPALDPPGAPDAPLLEQPATSVRAMSPAARLVLIFTRLLLHQPRHWWAGQRLAAWRRLDRTVVAGV